MRGQRYSTRSGYTGQRSRRRFRPVAGAVLLDKRSGAFNRSRWNRTAQPGRTRPVSAADLLLELASHFGVHTSYVDMAGKRQQAASESLKAVLQCLGVPANSDSEIRDSLLEAEVNRWREVLPPVLVAWDGHPGDVMLRLPQSLGPSGMFARIHFENGACKSLDLNLGKMRIQEAAEIQGRSYVARRWQLPALPLGYHQLEFELDERKHLALIIAAPRKSYSPPGTHNQWGLFAPAYALHSRASWGAGNLGDLKRLAEWSGQLGASVLATLPMLAAFLDAPVCEPSPYSPASRLFWNEFYLDLQAVPEFAAPPVQRLFKSAAFQQAVRGFRQQRQVEYRPEMRARRQILETMAKVFFAQDGSRRKTFQDFIKGAPRAADYAAFRATCDRTRAPWHTWDERMRHGKLQAGDFVPAVRDYHLYAQWLANQQIAALSGCCRDGGVRLYLDLPLGVNSDSYDLWRERDAFASGLSVGAPPDPVFAAGQDWGFAPLHPRRIRERGFGYVLEYLRFQMRQAGVLRIDHVLGLHRLFCIPRGFPPGKGAYVSYPAEELQALLSLESHRHKTIIAGENLGTVPPEVNEGMKRHELRETFVVQYEQQTNHRKALRTPPRFSVASLNTHDMPPFAAHCGGLDIEDRADLGLVARADLAKEQRNRKQLCGALRKFLRAAAGQGGDEENLLRACLQWLAAGPAETLLVNLEDLWGETEPQNVPGTSAERPNWKRKFRQSLESICESADIREFLRRVDRLRRRRSPRVVSRRSPIRAVRR